MNWAEVSIRTSHEAMELVAEIFHELGASGVVIEDPELLNSYIDSGLWDYTDIPRAEQTEIVTVKAYLPVDEELDDKLRAFEGRVKAMEDSGVAGGPCAISWNEVRDEDWAESWKQYFHPEKVGNLIVIKPSWEDYEAGPDDILVEIDPGAAFGTGQHPTTALCIRELEELVKGGMRVFDVGTGSGVLAITAAKLGATEVVAMDNDPTAVRIAGENVLQNHVEDVVSVGRSDILKSFRGKAHIIVANIIADIILKLFDELEEHLEPDGTLVAGGIIAERVADVTEGAMAHGFTVEKVVEDSGWAILVIRSGKKP